MLSKCHILCHKPETRDMLFRLFFFLFTSTSRLVSSRTSKIMGGLGRQMWHLPRLCVLPLSCRGGGGAEGKLESAAGTTVLRIYLWSPSTSLTHPISVSLPLYIFRKQMQDLTCLPGPFFHKFMWTLWLSFPTSHLSLLMCFMSVFYTFLNHLDSSRLHWSKHTFKPFRRNS